MNKELDNDLQDLIYLIKEHYNDALKNSESADESNNEYYKGQEIAFYTVLDLIESQLKVLDESNQLIGEIVPEIGKKAKY